MRRMSLLFLLVCLVLLSAHPLMAGPFEDANAASSRGDHATALKILRPLAEQGDAKAQTLLGFSYANGKGVTPDPAEAAKWFRNAAEQGDAEAQIILGHMYVSGNGVVPDKAEAKKLWQKAADQGNAEATRLLYRQQDKERTKIAAPLSKQSTSVDNATAQKGNSSFEDIVIKQFAELGSPDSQYTLGSKYATGQGVTKDFSQAVKWLRLAASNGHKQAQFDIGVMYASGHGVEKDLALAELFLKKAAAQGHPFAKKLCKDLQDKKNIVIHGPLSAEQHTETAYSVKHEDIKEAKKAYERRDYAAALAILRPLAEQGVAEAQFALGVMNYKGAGLPQDFHEALKWYRKAAEQGDAQAQTNLGMMHFNGQGTQADYSKALYWYQLAAKQGDSVAQTNLGRMYADGDGVKQDLTEAERWFQKAVLQGDNRALSLLKQLRAGGQPPRIAQSPRPVRTLADADAAVSRGEYDTALKVILPLAEGGDAEAQSLLGYMCYKGFGVPQSLTETIKWYRKAAEQGELRAITNLGAMYANGEGMAKNYAEAAKMYRIAADRGVAEALTNLGMMYAEGQGVAKNTGEAERLWRKAAVQGERHAQQYLKQLEAMRSGKKTTPDNGAAELFREAEAGNPLSQYKVGLLYAGGSTGIPKDQAKATQWFRKAAEQGLVIAQGWLGTMYSNGMGVQQDKTEAVKWYQLAASQGDSTSQFNLAEMYAHGQGVQRDMVQAYKWGTISGTGEMGVRNDRLEYYAKQMTPDQIAKAQQMAREWKPKTGQ